MKSRFTALIAAIILLAWSGRSYSQECVPYFIVEKGSVREMASYDKKDKLTGSTVQTVKDLAVTGNKSTWTISALSKDEKGKEISSGELTMSCEDGIFKMDMRNFIDDETMKGFEDMEVTIDATDLAYPGELNVGQSLPDGSLNMKVSSSGMAIMNMVVKVYDRKIEAKEDITTPAGTFSCYKMTSTVETKTMFTIIAKSTDWFAKNVGTVRSESYDKDGKLMGYSVLTSLKH
jgi:hypothetical protein